jgi:general L-amino acid transport system substrate-binding protein
MITTIYRKVSAMHFVKKTRMLVLLFLMAFAVPLFCTRADAADTLTRIKARGDVRCGVSDGIQGFSFKGPDGRWSGMDPDFCRALAAAVLGDPGKVDFVSLAAPARLASLKAGEIDVLVRNTTWTLERESTPAVLFAGILYYDGQNFLVSAGKNVQDLSQLNGATICVVKRTTHGANLADYFLGRNWTYRPLIVETQVKAAETLFSGQCDWPLPRNGHS